MTLPKTIQEVIQQLEQIVKDCENKDSRQGYFAALYLRVTKEVSRRINEKYFDDNPRMEQLDVEFANRYLIAYYQNQQQQQCTTSWQVAFDSCKKWKPLVMQHLLVGMNAHIGLDLGIAAATICPGDSIQTLHNDFNKINTVLAELVNTVENELSDMWPLLKPIDWLAGKLDEKIAVFSMSIARDAAWNLALQYAPLQQKAQQKIFIQLRDARVAAFGNKIMKPGFLLSNYITLFRTLERGTIEKKIKILNKGD